MDEYQMNRNDPAETEQTVLYPDLSKLNQDEDKYNVDTSVDQLDSDNHFDKWESPTYSGDELNNSRDKDLKLNCSNTKTASKSDSQEKRRNNRLQSGAGSDKYKNAQRFPGGHGKANAERDIPKVNVPADTDVKTSTGTGYQPDKKNSKEHGYREVNTRSTDESIASGHDAHHQSFVSRETEDFVFFWRAGSPFSQWHPASFTVDDVTFNCAEQYMMYHKAKTFNCDGVADLIMIDKNPYTIKQYGRQIPGFDPTKWRTVCEGIVKKGNIEKFKQNEGLKQKLFSTFPKTLVEASPHDQVWGIGLEANDPDAVFIERWKGDNLLGKILTEVRNELLQEIGFI